MKTIITLLIIIFSVQVSAAFDLKDNSVYSFSHTQKWDKVDKVLFASYTTFTIIDSGQTRDIFDNPIKFHEKNPVIRYGVKKFGKGSIPIYFIGCNILNYVVADHLKTFYIDVPFTNFTLPIPTRKLFLVGINAMEYDAVHHNYKVGVKITF